MKFFERFSILKPAGKPAGATSSAEIKVDPLDPARVSVSFSGNGGEGGDAPKLTAAAESPRFRDALAATEGALRELDAALRAHRGALRDADGARLYRAAGYLLELKREAAARRSRAKIKRARKSNAPEKKTPSKKS